MRKSSEGTCRFCLQSFSGSTMGKHLGSCKGKKERDAEEGSQAKTRERILHIKIGSGGEYWLHIEMKASSKLSDLDRFLRDTWLECCGHLSQFMIRGQAYMPSRAGNLREMEARSMDVPVGRVLGVKDKFAYEYDFGSTTSLEGRIVSEREGALKEKVRILARNRVPEAACSQCGKVAARLCTECEEFYCRACVEDHGCDEEMVVPVVNSPRMGVCGYVGELDPDDFEKVKDPDREARKRGLPEALIKFQEERRKKSETP